MVLSMCAQYDWSMTQYDVVAAYMLAKPSHTYYVRYPAGWRDYLRRKHGEPPYNPDDFYLRVDKNVYGREESGLIWFQMLSQFLTDELGWSSHAVSNSATALPLRGSRDP